MQFGIDPFGVGLIGGSGFLSAVVAQIGLANLADRGHARAMMVIGLVVAALSCAVLAQAESLPEFVAGRILLGLGHGTFIPAARRSVILKAGDQAGAALGQMNAFQLTGFLVGPMLGSVIFGFAGLTMVFVVFLALFILSVAMLARADVPVASVAPGPRVRRTLLKRRGMQAMICMVVGYFGSFGLFESIWAIFLSDLGASQPMIALNLTLFAVPMILLAPFGGRLATRHGAMRVAFAAVAVTIPFVGSYGIWGSVITLTALMMVQAIGDAIVMPASQLAVVEVSGDHIAAGQGLFGACGMTVAAAVAIAGGAVYSAYGPAVVFASCAGMMVVTLLGACWLGRETLSAPSSSSASIEIPSPPPVA